MKKKNLSLALGLANIGIFFIVVAYLPMKTSYSHTGAISQAINSRDRWDIPLFVLLGMLALSFAISILFSDDRKV